MDELYYYAHYDQGPRVEGPHVELLGNTLRLYGDCTFLTGDVSGISGNCAGLIGNCTGIFGDLDYIDLLARSPLTRVSEIEHYATEAEVNG
jgi:hypothetical protein